MFTILPVFFELVHEDRALRVIHEDIHAWRLTLGSNHLYNVIFVPTMQIYG